MPWRFTIGAAAHAGCELALILLSCGTLPLLEVCVRCGHCPPCCICWRCESGVELCLWKSGFGCCGCNWLADADTACECI